MRISAFRRRISALALLGALAAPAAGQPAPVLLADPFPNLTFAPLTDLQVDPDGRIFVLEKEGRVLSFENDSTTTAVVVALDLRDQVDADEFEQGLLGMAFDPDYATNGFVYLDYTTPDPDRTRISRFTRSAGDPLLLDPASETVLLEVAQPYAGHNAGAIAFGPPEGPAGERYLYVTLGDGGSGNDPQNNGQRPETLLGSILRLDVGGDEGAPLDCALPGGAATVPPDNPFVDGAGGACDEIYAYGFRNPWRMTLDAPTGQFWIGDVGQFAWEEVDLLEAGGNFGWRPYEGTHCVLGPCNPVGKVFPVWEYGHGEDGCSVIGGYVYRGAAIPELDGQYLFSDWCNGTIRALRRNGDTVTVDSLTTASPYSLYSFGQDLEGELYVVNHGDRIAKLVRRSTVSAEAPAPAPAALARLQLTGANPVRGRTTFRMEGDGPARLVVYDALGREVAVLFEGALRPAVPATVTFDARGLPAGAYFARLDTEAGTRTLPLTVVR